MKNALSAYELTFILEEKITPEKSTAKIKEVRDLVKKLEGTITKEELWGRRELAYPIKTNRSGFYVTFWIDFPKNNLIPLEQGLRFDESVIRFLTTKAYTTAQPGSLYPVSEEEENDEKNNKGSKKEVEEPATAEEGLRRSSTKTKKAAPEKVDKDAIPEGERLEKLDEALEVMLKDEE